MGHAVHAAHAMPRKSDVPIPSSNFFVAFLSHERIRLVLADSSGLVGLRRAQLSGF